LGGENPRPDDILFLAQGLNQNKVVVMTTEAEQIPQQNRRRAPDLQYFFNLEILITIFTLVIGAVIYSFATFSYANSTYLTVREADVRKESRDKDIETLKATTNRIEKKLDKVLGIPTDD
jgi:cell division protein FtsB